MAKITYRLDAFNYKEAESGHLCVVTDEAGMSSSSVDNIELKGKTFEPNTHFVGAGVCTVQNGTYKLAVDSTVYTFNSSGNAYDSQTNGKYLYLADIEGSKETSSPSSFIAGNMMEASFKVVTTKSYSALADAGEALEEGGELSGAKNRAGGEVASASEIVKIPVENGAVIMKPSDFTEKAIEEETVITNTETKVNIDSLTPRDQFAMEAMKGIIAATKEPAGLSNSAVLQNCEAAYQWAANMMLSAANARAILDDKTEDLIIQMSKVGAFNSNFEKIVNNIVASLAWTKKGKDSEGKDIIEIYTMASEFYEYLTLMKEYLKHTAGTGDTQKYARFEDLTSLLKKVQETVDDKTYERVSIKDFNTVVTKIEAQTTAITNMSSKMDTMSTNLGTIATFMETLATNVSNLCTAVNGVEAAIRETATNNNNS